MKIPFNWLPASWGLTGKTRLRAEAEYLYRGKELDLRLAEIDKDELGELGFSLRTLEIKKKHGEISEIEFDLEKAKVELKDKPDELAFQELEIQFRHHKIEKNQYEKSMADLKQEPWVSMPNISWDPNDPSKSFFELDYNDYFVKFLRENGYNGETDEIAVERWLSDVCRSVVLDMSNEDPSFISTSPLTISRTPKKGKRKKAEYS